MQSLHVIYASTSGNTEHVVETLGKIIAAKDPAIAIERQRAESAHPKDFLRGDVLVLGSGTWNTDGTEGQLNPIMHELLLVRAKDIDLQGKPITFISLGDERYYYRARCTEHLLRFQRDHQGILFIPPLVLVNDPYGQEDRIREWADKLLDHMARGRPAHVRKPPITPIVS